MNKFSFGILILSCFILISCETPGYGDGKHHHQGVSFSFLREMLVMSGDLNEGSDFTQGDHVAVYSDEKCFQKVSDNLPYDMKSDVIKLNTNITLTEYREYILYIGILKNSSLVKCLENGIRYTKTPPAPTGLFLIESNYSDRAYIGFSNLVSGVSHIRFFSDEACSLKISGELSTEDHRDGAYATDILSVGSYKIYARFLADKISSPCSNDHVSYESRLSPVSSIVFVSKTDGNTLVKVSGVDVGDEVQLFSDSDCSENISPKIVITGK